MRALLSCAVGLLLVVSTAKADDKIDAKMLIGKWTPKDIPPVAKIEVELTADGKVIMSVEFAGKKDKAEGTYKIDGNKLTVTIAGPGGKEEKDEMTVLTLNDSELVTKDSKGKTETMKKVKN